MTLKDLLRRKEKLPKNGSQVQRSVVASPEFTFIRSDTNTEEILTLPSSPPVESSIKQSEGVPKGKRISRFGSLSNASNSVKDHRTEKRLSSLLDRRSHSYASSVNIPTDLPSIVDGKEGSDEKEARWEHRATILAKENPNLKHSITSNDTSGQSLPVRDLFTKEVISTRPVAHRAISDAEGDDHIQEAIKLHEAGDLTQSTQMFGRLANPDRENNALSQVLYGLALRHGWGISPDPSLAITYLSLAASNCASIESQALSSGMKRGGAAKGELVLAIYELANCFRHGWGVAKDPVAARSYYETAANLGDVDAMNEAARCYEEGFGGRKDKFKAAQLYRMAEEKGSKTLGNSWIWKDKYNMRLGE